MLTFFILFLSALAGTTIRAGNMVLVLYAVQLGASTLVVGTIGAMFAVLPMLFSLQAGRLADRYGSHVPLLICSAGSALGLLLPWAFPGIAAAFVAAALVGLSFAMMVPLQNLMGLLSTPATRARNFANFSLGMSFGTFAGPLIGGFVVDLAGPAVTCLWLSLIGIGSVAMLLAWGKRLPRSPVESAAPGKGSVYALLKNGDVRRTIGTSSLINVGRELYQVYFPVYAHGVGLSASMIGIVQASTAAAEFVVRFFLPRLLKALSEERLLAYSFFVSAASLVLIPFFARVELLILLSVVFGLGMGCGQPVITMLMYNYSPKGRSGEALGLRMTFIHVTRLIGPVAFGAIGTAFGITAMFIINAAVMVGGGALSRPRGADRPAAKAR